MHQLPHVNAQNFGNITCDKCSLLKCGGGTKGTVLPGGTCTPQNDIVDDHLNRIFLPGTTAATSTKMFFTTVCTTVVVDTWK
jgi:hypothetical protein